MVPVAGVEPARPKALDFESIILDVNIYVYLVFYEQYVCNVCATAINLGCLWRQLILSIRGVYIVWLFLDQHVRR